MSDVLVRIIGETQFRYRRPPGDGADQIEAHWNVGKESMVLIPDKRGEFTGLVCRLIDWFQPDGDPALTVYVFVRTEGLNDG